MKAGYNELTAKAAEVLEQCYYMRNDLSDLGVDTELTPAVREALIVTLNQLNYEATALLQSLLLCRNAAPAGINVDWNVPK